MSNAPKADAGGVRADPLLSLRKRILTACLAILALAMPLVSVVIALANLREGTYNGIVLALCLYTLVFPLLWLLRRRLGFSISAILLVSLLALTAFLVEARGGVAAGNTLVNALTLILAGVLFGRRGAVIAVLVVFGLFAVGGLLVLGGHAPRLDLTMWDPLRTTYWVRELAAIALLAPALVVVPVYAIERLMGEAERLRQLAEAERAQLAALERAEREREQERERRLEALKALEESRKIEALARLAGGIAHDFNNALTVIMGAASEVAAAAPGAEIQANARAILEAGGRAAEMTRELLALGQGQVAKPQPVSLAPALSRLGPALRRLVPTDIALHIETPPESVAIEVDRTGLERALLNLVINARDAMPLGGRLSIGCALVAGAEDSPAQVALTVADTGTGMTQETLERIFEPFFTTKKPGIGSGLGLATVQAFVKESRGEIRVSSAPDQGTTFTLLFPACSEPCVPEPEAARPERLAGTTARRVLLVEDDDAVRSTMARTLARGGLEVTEAADGDQAMALLAQRDDFDLLCIDGVMPGVPTSRIIERAEQRPSLRILLCSGYLPEDLLRRGVRAGRYAYLQKPYSPAELIAAVERVLARAVAAEG